jgi:hypothetical protein
MQLLPKEMLELFPKTALTGKTLEMGDRMHCFSTIFLCGIFLFEKAWIPWPELHHLNYKLLRVGGETIR